MRIRLRKNLNEEGCIELPDCDLILVPRRGHQTVQDLFWRSLPDLLHDVSKFCVALVNRSVHFDFQTRSYHSKKGRPELHGAVGFQRHVHGNKAFAGHSMGTEFAKAERWRDLPEQGYHIDVLDPPLRVRVVLTPEPDKLVKVMGTQDGPVAGEVVKVVHDHGHEQVEDEEAADDEEGDEVEVGKVGATASALGVQIVRLWVALRLWLVCAVQHDFLPALPSGRTKEDQQSLKMGN